MTHSSSRIATFALSIVVTGCPAGDDSTPAADDSSSSGSEGSSSTSPTTAPPTTSTTATSTTDVPDTSSTGGPADGSSSSSESTSTSESSSSSSSSDDESSSSDDESSSSGGAQLYELLDPDGVHFGLDYQGWAGAWWQWCRGLPATDHPLFDDLGTECATGQGGDVFFLGGTFGGAPVMRTCTTPADTVVLIPIVNATWDNAGYSEADWWSDEMNAEGVAEFIDSVDELSLEIDGDLYENDELAAYRVGVYQSSYDVPAKDNLFEYFGYDEPVAGTVDPTFGDGYYVMIDLEPGEHEIRVYALSGAYGFSVDASYTLTVE